MIQLCIGESKEQDIAARRLAGEWVLEAGYQALKGYW